MDLLALADFNLVARHGGLRPGCARRLAPESDAVPPCRGAGSQPQPAPVRARRARAEAHRGRTARSTSARARCSPSSTKPRRRSPRAETGREADCGSAHRCCSRRSRWASSPPSSPCKYPQVRLEVTTEDRAVDMVEEGYDLVIRVNPEPDERLVGRVFLRDRLVVVASPTVTRPKRNVVVPAVVRGAGRSERCLGCDDSSGTIARRC